MWRRVWRLPLARPPRLARPETDLDHAAGTDRAHIDAMTGEDHIALAIVDGLGGRRRFGRIESGANADQLGSAASVRQESEVTDTAKPFLAARGGGSDG